MQIFNSYQEATEDLLNKQIDDATRYKKPKTEKEQEEELKKENEYWIKLVFGDKRNEF